MSRYQTKTSKLLALLDQYFINSSDAHPKDLLQDTSNLKGEQSREREETALHEAAHFVAACAFRGSSVTDVYVNPRGKTSRHYLGTIQASEIFQEQSYFVTVSGIEWERLVHSGDISRASGDVSHAEAISCGRDAEISRDAALFVFVNFDLICAVAIAILKLSKKDGRLGHKPLSELAQWVRGIVVRPSAEWVEPTRPAKYKFQATSC